MSPESTPDGRATSPGALAGIRVLDLSRLLPGGFCSLLLADFGADVLKVEDTGMGDYIRWSLPYVDGVSDSAKSALFLSLNRNKRSIRLDLKSERGRDALLALVRESDVVLESFRPGVLARLGVRLDQVGTPERAPEAPVLAHVAGAEHHEAVARRIAARTCLIVYVAIGLGMLAVAQIGREVRAHQDHGDVEHGKIDALAAAGTLALEEGARKCERAGGAGVAGTSVLGNGVHGINGNAASLTNVDHPCGVLGESAAGDGVFGALDLVGHTIRELCRDFEGHAHHRVGVGTQHVDDFLGDLH